MVVNELDLDGILVEIGEMGKFQILNYVLMSLTVIFTSSSYLSYIFTTGALDYRCKIPECELSTTSNEYLPNWISNAIPFDENTNLPSQCLRYQYINGNSSGDDSDNGDIVHYDDTNKQAINRSSSHHQQKDPLITKQQFCPTESFNRSNLIRCNEFIFDGDELTILNEFNVTCADNQWRLTIIGSLGYIAELIMLPITAVLSDKYGRRPILISTILIGGICGIIKSLSTTYRMFAIMEFVTGLATCGTYMTVFVMAIEFSGPNKRVFGGALISAIYSTTQMLSGIVAMYFPNFRTYLQMLYVPHILVITFVWIIPESYRWLLSKGNISAGRKILNKAAKMNGVQLSEGTLNRLNNFNDFSDGVLRGNGGGIDGGFSGSNNDSATFSGDESCGEIKMIKITTESKLSIDKEQKYEKSEHNNQPEHETNHQNNDDKITTIKPKNAFLIAIRSKSLMLRLLNCLFCWFTNSFIYYGMTVNSVALAGSKYVNYILVNLVELPAVMISYYLMDKLGRKKTLCSCLFLCGVGCVVSEFIDESLVGLRLTLFIIGKAGVTVAFTILYVFSSELFPTYLRHSFMNVCSTVGSVGSMIAPQTPLLMSYWPPLPLILFGGSALLCGLAVLFLPETLNTKLPDTVEEAEHLGKTDHNNE